MKHKKEHTKPIFKLDEMPKKEVFSVPDDYFDNLPNIIQSRVVKPEAHKGFVINWSLTLRYALPVMALAMMVSYFAFRINKNDIDVQAMLDDIPTEELITYLAESDLSTEDILSMVDLEEFDVDGMIEDNIQLLNDDEWDDILEDYPDLENDI